MMIYFLSISESILLFISGFGIVQGILLAALIFFHPRSDRSVNTFLALHILFVSLAMTMPFTVRLISWQRGNLMQPFLLLPAIFLYLYIRSFKERISLKKTLPHLFVFFLFLLAVGWNVSLNLAKYPNVKVPPAEAFHDPFNILITAINYAIKIVYYFLARKTLKSYQRSIRQLFSETSRINLSWARVLLNGYLFLLIAGIVSLLLMMSYPQQFNLLLLVDVAVATPYIYLATYKGITQPTIWQWQPGTNKDQVEEKIFEVEKIENIVVDEKNRFARPGPDENKINMIAKKVVALLEEEKLYQETELTLQQLSDKLGLHTYQVSQAINEGLKKNFYDLVNNYRVEEAKRLLLHPKNVNYTVLSVGFEAGFNSKTTFNTVFKKFTGVTPTEYRDKQKQLQLTV
jgi:AraC-like DNA-binding protein